MLKTSHIYQGDNLRKLKEIPDQSIDLIYLDPPFNSGRDYEIIWKEDRELKAFRDRFGSTDKFVAWMRPRCVEMRRVLKPTGHLVFHCDPHANYGVRRLLQDELRMIFVNEIVWQRTTTHGDSKQGAKHFGRVHDTIFIFAKRKGKRTWNTQFQPYSQEYLDRDYKHVDPDGRRWRRGDLTAAKPGGDTSYEWKGQKPYKGRYWAYSQEEMERLDREGRIHYTKTGRPELKRFLDEGKGVPISDTWTDIPVLHSLSKERVGYPTQKPLALMERILKTMSNEGDLVLDPFCGCGTTIVAAASLFRRWIGVDLSPTAVRVVSERLWRDLQLREGIQFFTRTLAADEAYLRGMDPFDFQNWAVTALGGIPNLVKGADKGIDGRLYLVDSNVPKGAQLTLDFMHTADESIPIQVKQKNKIGRPDVDAFETAMRRGQRSTGIMVGFAFTSTAKSEIERAGREDKLTIVPITVREILERRAA